MWLPYIDAGFDGTRRFCIAIRGLVNIARVDSIVFSISTAGSVSLDCTCAVILRQYSLCLLVAPSGRYRDNYDRA